MTKKKWIYENIEMIYYFIDKLMIFINDNKKDFKLNTDNKDLSELDELKDKAGDPIVLTKAKIKSVFRNSCSGKVKSRVVLNKFIEKVA